MPICIALRALVACVLLLSPTIPGVNYADAAGPRRDAGAHPGRFIEEYAERLGLEAGTVAAIRTIAEATHLQNKALGEALHQGYAQMRALLSQEMPDEAAVMQQIDTIGAVELALRKNRLQAMLRIRTLLTPAQRQKLAQLQEESAPRGRLDSIHVCQADSATLCPDVAPGRARLQCLHDHREALSEPCRAALQTRKGDRPGP